MAGESLADGNWWEYDEEELPDEQLVGVCPNNLGGMGLLVPRDYQLEAIAKFWESIQQHRSCLLQLATGMGKTVIAAEIALQWPESAGRVLFLAHRKELIEQAAKTIGAHIGEDCGIEMGEASEAKRGTLIKIPKVLVGSVQTLSKPTRLQALRPRDFGLIIVDECHHATAESYKTVLGWLQNNRQLRHLGITATPDRADEVMLGEIYDVAPFSADICFGIDNGYLVPIQQKFVFVSGLDFGQCRTTAGDLNERDLERQMMGANADELGKGKRDEDLTEDEIEARRKVEKMLHAVADPAIREANGRPGIVFCVTVAHAEQMAAMLRRYNQSAECVTQKTSPDERRETIARFREGKLQWLVGVGVFTEGFDAWKAAVIVNCRQTKSRALYTQIVGRGTRPDPAALVHDTPEARKEAIAASSKPFCTVLDFVGASGRHKLVCTGDILGDAYPEDLRQVVLDRLRAISEQFDPREEFAREQQRREEMERLKKEQEAQRREAAEKRAAELRARLEQEDRLRHERAVAKYKVEDVDPFGDSATIRAGLGAVRRGSCSDKQVEYLVSLGVSRENAMGMDKRQAGAVIDSMMARRGGEYRITFGKHKGKSLALAGEGFAWWVQNQMEEGPKRHTLLQHIALWREEQKLK
jgi:superfamily II DNA or RNA helicase